MSMGITHDKLTLIQVMAFCCQTTYAIIDAEPTLTHTAPYGFTRSQWVLLLFFMMIIMIIMIMIMIMMTMMIMMVNRDGDEK